MGSLAHRLSCFVMAFALSGSPAVLAACAAQCLASPLATTSTMAAPAHHEGHEAAPAAVSPHAHHGAAAPNQVTERAANASPDARLSGTCDCCCDGSAAEVALGAGIERIDGKAFAVAHVSPAARFELSATMGAAVPTIPDVPPPLPPRARLALRI